MFSSQSDIISKIIYGANQVYKRFGVNSFVFSDIYTINNKFPYKRELALEMKILNLVFMEDYKMTVFFQEQEISTHTIDFLVENQIPIEISSTHTLDKVYLNTISNNLQAYYFKVGLLLNFGQDMLEYKVIEIKKLKPI